MTFSGTPTTIGSANTTYQILINSTDGSQDSEVLTASISVLPLTPGTLTLTSGSATQNVYTGQNLANIVYTYGGGATGATVSGLPSGVDYTVDAARAGIYTSLIRERTPLETIDFEAVKKEPSLLPFGQDYRAKKLGGAV